MKNLVNLQQYEISKSRARTINAGGFTCHEAYNACVDTALENGNYFLADICHDVLCEPN